MHSAHRGPCEALPTDTTPVLAETDEGERSALAFWAQHHFHHAERQFHESVRLQNAGNPIASARLLLKSDSHRHAAHALLCVLGQSHSTEYRDGEADGLKEGRLQAAHMILGRIVTASLLPWVHGETREAMFALLDTVEDDIALMERFDAPLKQVGEAGAEVDGPSAAGGH